MANPPFMLTWITELWELGAILGKTHCDGMVYCMLLKGASLTSFALLCCWARSWYPVVYDQFLVKPTEEYHHTIWLLPLERDDNASIIAGTKGEGAR